MTRLVLIKVLKIACLLVLSYVIWMSDPLTRLVVAIGSVCLLEWWIR